MLVFVFPIQLLIPGCVITGPSVEKHGDLYGALEKGPKKHVVPLPQWRFIRPPLQRCSHRHRKGYSQHSHPTRVVGPGKATFSRSS